MPNFSFLTISGNLGKWLFLQRGGVEWSSRCCCFHGLQLDSREAMDCDCPFDEPLNAVPELSRTAQKNLVKARICKEAVGRANSKAADPLKQAKLRTALVATFS